METRKLKKRIKEKIGLGTPSRAESQQASSSGPPVATECTLVQVSASIIYYALIQYKTFVLKQLQK